MARMGYALMEVYYMKYELMCEKIYIQPFLNNRLVNIDKIV